MVSPTIHKTSPIAPHQTAQLLVLVVEDEALIAMLVEDALIYAGYRVIGPAATVAEAMEALDSQCPHAVVLDLNLAGESAKPVSDELARRGIPYVITTGYGPTALPPGHEEGAVLAKPYDPRDLIRLLRCFAPRNHRLP